MALPKIEVGDYVQVDHEGHWAHNVMMKVEWVAEWGCAGLVHGPHDADYPLRVGMSEIAGVYRRVEIKQ